MLSVRFWGVRGSIPCPGPDTVLFGGNTACVEIRADDRLLIVDLGTGIRPLGDWLMANDFRTKGRISADIFVTHTHWDHVLGFPMFTPVYVKGTELRITGPVSFENENLKDIIQNQFSYRYWPVRAGELAANIEYNQIKETLLDLGGGLTVASKFLNHPVFCLGYRFNYKGKSIAVVFDHEPFRNLFSNDPADEGYNEELAKEGEIAAAEENEKIRNFICGADIVIHDAQYSEEEYATHIGWGHASMTHAVLSITGADVKKLVFFHHDPTHTDSQLEQFEKIYKTNMANIFMAKEGMILEA
ncbi:MAG: MBL fold metallo-hydrolase [Treponema sp.]|jgi:phosphoribosyl 1,2-cyclic phosphodiesterase|nr:MBL fold metallo-hydrolase [Treponema sp.]